MIMNFKNLIKAIKPPLLLLIALAVLTLQARAQVTPTTLTSVFTNNPTVITNGATTLAGTTNITVDIRQGRGLGLQFSALATNAGQITFYIVPSVDGTNFTDALGCWQWGHALNASGWITRMTNIPASVTDNYRKAKILIVSNAAAYVVISNTVWSRYP